MNWLARLFAFYLLPALLGLTVFTVIFLIASIFTSEDKLFTVFIWLALLPPLYYFSVHNTACFGMAGLLQQLLKMLPNRRRDEEGHVTVREELAEISRENIAHTFAALCVIASIFVVHMALEFLLGHDAKLFDRIPIRYIFDLAHIVVLAKLIFTLSFLQRVKRSWAGSDCSTSELTQALKDENPKVRRKAAQLLGEWRRADAEDAALALTDAMNDSDKTVRRYVSTSLRQISERSAENEARECAK